MNYNMASLMGNDEITDEEYVTEFGLDPALAGTPGINDAMLERVKESNIQYFVEDGMTQNEATEKAEGIRQQAARQVKERMAAKGLL